MACPSCSGSDTHPVGLGHSCSCGHVWLQQGDPPPEQQREYYPTDVAEEEK